MQLIWLEFWVNKSFSQTKKWLEVFKFIDCKHFRWADCVGYLIEDFLVAKFWRNIYRLSFGLLFCAMKVNEFQHFLKIEEKEEKLEIKNHLPSECNEKQ